MTAKVGLLAGDSLGPGSIDRWSKPVQIQVDFPLSLGTIQSIEMDEASGPGECRAVLKVG